jgi:hypothetical protein
MKLSGIAFGCRNTIPDIVKRKSVTRLIAVLGWEHGRFGNSLVSAQMGPSLPREYCSSERAKTTPKIRKCLLCVVRLGALLLDEALRTVCFLSAFECGVIEGRPRTELKNCSGSS